MAAPRTFFKAAPRFSRRLYLQLDPCHISLLKFFLEAHDNLAYLTTVSPHTAVVKLVFAPCQAREVRDFLETMRGEIGFREVTIGADGEGGRT